MTPEDLGILEHVELAPLTTLKLGGKARFLSQVRDEAHVSALIGWAKAQSLPWFVVGFGSNLVVGDAGYDGLVIHFNRGEFSIHEDGRVEADAGADFDSLVAATVDRGFAALACLSGIPGSVGATPIQNVGAYGAEISKWITSVRVYDCELNVIQELNAFDCGFSYRDSYFKKNPGKYIVLKVSMSLDTQNECAVSYKELQESLQADTASAALIREHVLKIRARKSMVIDEADPNSRSVGSFFTNPIVSELVATDIIQKALRWGLVRKSEDVPIYPAPDQKRKLAAAWLIQNSGFSKGYTKDKVGISSAHTLALVHHGGGTTEQLLALAREVRERVWQRFGVELDMEPRTLGCEFQKLSD